MEKSMSQWEHMDKAPKDGTQVLACARGLDNRPLYAVVSWTDPSTMFDSSVQYPDYNSPNCEWVENFGIKFGVKFEYWKHLTPPEGLKGLTND